MWTAVRYLGAARKILNDGFYWQMFSPMVLEMEISCPSNSGPLLTLQALGMLLVLYCIVMNCVGLVGLVRGTSS